VSVGLSVSRIFISVPFIHPFNFPANRVCITRGQCVNFIVRFISCVHKARTEQVNVGLKFIRTASLTGNNSTFCPHSVFMCFVWISEQTAIISLYSIN